MTELEQALSAARSELKRLREQLEAALSPQRAQLTAELEQLTRDDDVSSARVALLEGELQELAKLEAEYLATARRLGVPAPAQRSADS